MFRPEAHVVARQLWNLPTTTSTHTRAHCTPFTLPSNGVITLGDSSVITLTTDVVFQPQCTGSIATQGEVFSVGHLMDPFYASTIPMVYVISAATVIAWILVVMLTITPRTSFFGTPITAQAFSNSHGIIGGANGGMSGLSGSGSRPWLQKVAALAVAISLTIATADTLEVAQKQYYSGFMDAVSLRKEVLGSLEIRTTRVVSDIFLWLAQVQTLIRLFPRHKEKVLIKWIGFVLIILDTIFSCLNSFMINSQSKGRHFVDAIPALSYLFELALGLLYAAWVMYYALTKRRYAFYHAKMRSILLIALLSLVSILTPVVFFVTDVSNQDVAGWGDYFRWVGAAAASVVVWEWVERIEALERDDKKDGILGREIFDGDEMLDVMPSEEAAWSESRNLRRNFRRPRRDDEPAGDHNHQSMAEHGLSGVANRFRSKHQQSPQHFPRGGAHSTSQPTSDDNGPTGPRVTFDQPARPDRNLTGLGGVSPPLASASPVSRADTTSAASTVYVVRYHPMAGIPQPIRRRVHANDGDHAQNGNLTHDPEKEFEGVEEEPQPNRNREQSRWRNVPNPFKRKRTSPPQEVQRARAAAGQRGTTQAQNPSKWDMRDQSGALTAEDGDGHREGDAGRKQEAHVPVTVVPAQPRGSGRTWSPQQNIIMTSAGVDDADESLRSRGTTSTTVTVDGHRANPQGKVAGRHRATSSTTATSRSAPSTTNCNQPPRADDISPVAGRNAATVVVPAPRRTPQQDTPTSPIHGTGSTTSIRRGSAADRHRAPSPVG